MYIDRLKLQNFRNIKNADINFGPKLNVLVGKNGMGKTNVLESIYLLCIGRSPRAVKDSECINFDENSSNINLNYIRNQTKRNINMTLYKDTKKVLLLDNMQCKRLSDIVGHFGCVYFSPIELNIVSGAPGMRRRFMDIINCQISPQYMNELFRYQHAIKQRNNYLKKHKNKEYNLELESWDLEMAKLCASICKRRQIFIDRLNEVAVNIHSDITNKKESIIIKYEACFEDVNNTSFDNMVNIFLQKMKQNYERDKILEYTSFGCQNDDLNIKLQYLNNGEIIKTINLKKSGSQGQQRTAVLSMKLAELEILKTEYDEPPVMLLDDVLGELDDERKNALLSYCKNFQTIVTCTEWNIQQKGLIFDVKNGQICTKTT